MFIFDPVAGGEALLVIEVGSIGALVLFADKTGAPRLACGSDDGKVRVFDPVAGGEALLVINAYSKVNALAFFKDPATGAPRLACASGKKVLVFDPVVGGGVVLRVLDLGDHVTALAVLKEPATGAPRLACGSAARWCAAAAFSGGARCSCSTWVLWCLRWSYSKTGRRTRCDSRLDKKVFDRSRAVRRWCSTGVGVTGSIQEGRRANCAS